MTAFQHRLPRLFVHLALALLAGLGAFGSVHAQAPEADPPGRVARIADIQGQAWLYSPDTGEWIAAVRNRPVTSGDRLATDADGRLELSIGSTTLRLDSGSEVEVLRLDDSQVALHLHNGSAAARIRDARAVGEFELTTTEGRFRVQTAGRYRFDRFDRSSDLTVYAGQAIYEGPGSALTLYSGQRGEFWLEQNGAAQYSITEPVRDAFASWIADRDRAEDRLAAVPRYVSPEMTGAQDLNRYGRWEQSPDYGPLWFPRGVAVGWAPYSTGHWTWVRPWGWTWVDEAPWGFAPFHYGRWVYYRNSWCWAPGTFVARPIYAPALVAWVGGPRLSVSISIGGPAVGWFPLAPREVYVPAYRASPRYVREVNVTHVTNTTNITNVINNPPRDFSNRKYPHAVTVVPASVLTNREPVAPSAARLRDLPPVRAIVNEPARAVATATPPVASPPPAQRGIEARPFRPGEGAPGNRIGRGGQPPLNPAEPRGQERRDAGAGTPAAAVAPVVPVRPATAVPVRPAAAPPLAPAAAPVARSVPPPIQARPGEGQMRTIPRNEREDRRDQGRERGREQAREQVREAGPPRAAAAAAHPPAVAQHPVAPAAPPAAAKPAPPPPQVVSRPVPAAPVVRPAEAPRAHPPAPAQEARPPDQRSRGDGPPGRDERREPGERPQTR